VRRTPVFPGGMTAAVGYLPPEKLSLPPGTNTTSSTYLAIS
jgi:hypothetical protein